MQKAVPEWIYDTKVVCGFFKTQLQHLSRGVHVRMPRFTHHMFATANSDIQMVNKIAA